MDEKNTELEEVSEFDLEDILNEFHQEPSAEEAGSPEDTDFGKLPKELPELELNLEEPQDSVDLDKLLDGLDLSEETEDTPAKTEKEPVETSEPEETPQVPEEEAENAKHEDGEAAAEEAEDEKKEPALEGDTVRFAPITDEQLDQALADIKAEMIQTEKSVEPSAAVEETFIPAPIVFTPRSRLRELKKKLVSGPEKRYYELAEMGMGKLQLAILVNVVLVLICTGVTAMFAMGLIPENRLRLVIFSQVLAMLVSALMGSGLLVDSVVELFKGRFGVNTLLTITFIACMADAVLCLMELRVPCCAAFSVEMTMALWARSQRHNTEMAQMDTMRKAVRLHGIVRTPDFYQGQEALQRTEAEVEDFMETYDKVSGPQLVQSIYAGMALLACVCIAVLAGLSHGMSMALQIFATSLLVAVPASFFVSVTRPMAILEQRLHMVGTVLCGWAGVKGLCGKAIFPLEDDDLFPQGSTKLNGVKFYGDRDPDEVVSATASLISCSGGGLVPVFQQLMNSRNVQPSPVENFRNYGGGGIGGEVGGEPVLLGSLNFMQDMGVEIPEGTMVSQAVYAAMDGQLCAVYAISYAKMRSAAAGLVTLCTYPKLTPMMLCGDFMLTESFLRAKFEVKTKRIAFPEREVVEQLRKVQPAPEARVLAITTREELVSAAYAVTGARAVRTATRLGVILHMISGILGLVIMLVLAILGNTELLTPINILLYQLIWAIPGLLVTEWARTV